MTSPGGKQPPKDLDDTVGVLGIAALRRSSMRKAVALGPVSNASRAHLCTMCGGNISKLVYGFSLV